MAALHAIANSSHHASGAADDGLPRERQLASIDVCHRDRLPAIAGLALIVAGLAANSAEKSATAANDAAAATKGLVEIETECCADKRAERDRDEEARRLALEEADLAHLRLELRSVQR